MRLKMLHACLRVENLEKISNYQDAFGFETSEKIFQTTSSRLSIWPCLE